MIREEFEAYVSERFNRIVDMVNSKGKEYARGDAFSNFKGAMHLVPCKTQEKALWGMVVKHIEAVKTFIDDLEHDGGTQIPIDQWKEKTGDIVVYMMLLEGMRIDAIRERHNITKIVEPERHPVTGEEMD